MKIRKKLGNIMILCCISATMVHASKKHNIVSMGVDTETISLSHIDNMSTVQLQKEVERLSKRGEVSLELGLELMRRWTKG